MITIQTFEGAEKIKIPPSTQNGQILKIKGKGFHQVNRWSRGDLLVQVQVVTPRNLSRQETELFKKLRELEAAKDQPLSETDRVN